MIIDILYLIFDFMDGNSILLQNSLVVSKDWHFVLSNHCPNIWKHPRSSDFPSFKSWKCWLSRATNGIDIIEIGNKSNLNISQQQMNLFFISIWQLLESISNRSISLMISFSHHQLLNLPPIIFSVILDQSPTINGTLCLAFPNVTSCHDYSDAILFNRKNKWSKVILYDSSNLNMVNTLHPLICSLFYRSRNPPIPINTVNLQISCGGRNGNCKEILFHRITEYSLTVGSYPHLEYEIRTDAFFILESCRVVHHNLRMINWIVPRYSWRHAVAGGKEYAKISFVI